MPSYVVHIRRSVERTGESYRELNEWLDGDKVSIPRRLQRHIGFKRYSKYVQSKWGEEGLEEYRSHLSDDFRMPLVTLLGLFLWRIPSKLTAQVSKGGDGKR